MKGISAGLLLLLFCSFSTSAQPPSHRLQQHLLKLNSFEERYQALLPASIDSIRNSIPTFSDTLIKIDVILTYIDRMHSQIDASRGEEELKLSYTLSRKISYQGGIAKSLKSLGDIYSAKGDFAKAISYFNASIEVARKIPYYEVLSANMASLGSVYKKKSDYDNALHYYLQAVDFSEHAGNPALTARRLYNVASFYKSLGNEEASLKYAFSSLQKSQDSTVRTFNYHLISELLSEQKKYDEAMQYLRKSLQILPHNAGVLYHIGLLYKLQQKNDSALFYLEKSLKAIPEGGSFKNLRLDAMADIYEQQGNFTQALQHRLASLASVIQLNEKTTEAQCYNKLAQHYALCSQPLQTIHYAKKALLIAKELHLLSESKEAYHHLSKAYAATGQYQPAYQFSTLFQQINDSVNNTNTLKKLVQLEMEYEFNKKEAARKASLEKQAQQAQLKERQQNFFIGYLTVCSVLCALLALIFYRYYRLKKKDNMLLQQYNQEVNEQKEEIANQADKLKKANEHILQINNTLETTVLQRTRQLEKQNRQLINYAFYNAHKLRGPLARILGLVFLLKNDTGHNPAETQLYLSKLEQSSVELDHVVKEINTILQTQDAVDEQVSDCRQQSLTTDQ